MLMLRTAAFLAIPLLCSGQEVAAEHPLSTALEVRSLSREEADTGKPVTLTGTVIFSDPPATAFLQDGSAGTFFRLNGRKTPLPGDRVRVTGLTFPGLFLPGIEHTEYEILGREPLPDAVAANYDDLLSGQLHYQRVSYEGIIRTVIPEEEGITRVIVAKNSRLLEIRVEEASQPDSPGIDSLVRVSGLAAGHINHRHQLVEPYIRSRGWNEFAILRATPPLEDIPEVTPQQILSFDIDGRFENRVKLSGVVLAALDPGSLYLRQDGSAVGVRLSNPRRDLQPGQRVEVVGFPEMAVFSAQLGDAQVLSSSDERTKPEPIPLGFNEVFTGTHDNDLVVVEGTVSEWHTQESDTVLIMRQDGRTLTARVGGFPDGLQAGVRASLTGIARVESASGTAYRSRPEVVSLTLRDHDDFAVIRAPRWWNTERLATALFAVLAATLISALWIFLLRRQVRQQTEALTQSIQHEAALEERQRLAREFHDTLEQDLAGLSLRLDAATAKSEDSSIRDFIVGSRNLVSRIQQETRNLVSDLRDHGDGERNLNEALAGLHADLPSQVGPELEWDLAEIAPLPSRTTHHLKMITREGITNALKHADASRVCISTTTRDETLHLSVIDDGRGLSSTEDTQGKSGHFGCMGIRERARRIGATISWESPESGGTCLKLTLPLTHD